MIGFGAIVKSVERWVDGAVEAAIREIKRASENRRPRPCPILVRDQGKKRRG